MLKIITAKNWWQGMCGLIGRESLQVDEAFLIPECKQVHTWFMRYPLDVVWLDSEQRVIAGELGLKPWRISKRVPTAKYCVELAGGGVRRYEIKRGGKIF